MAAGTAIGGLAGGSAGAAAGLNEISNNGLGTVLKHVGVPAIMACLKIDSCRAMTGVVGAAIALQAAQLMKDNPAMGEGNAYAIAVVDLSNYGLAGKPATPLPGPLPTTTAGTPLQTNTNTGGDQTATPSGLGSTSGGYGAGARPTIDPIVMSVDRRLPINSPTAGTNGLQVESNGKHTPGLPGYNPNAGTEPRNSLDLFNSSTPNPNNPDVRYSVDGQGNVNRFSTDGNGTFHWTGSTGDRSAPLNPQTIPVQIRRLPGVKL